MSDWMNAENVKLILLVLGTLVTGVYGNSWLKRRGSKDRIVVATDDGEKSLIENLTADIHRREQERVTDYQRWSAERAELIARADRINEERNRAVEQIGALRQQVHDLSAKVLELSGHVERLEAIANGHKEVAEALRAQLDAFMKIHVRGGELTKGEK